MNRYASRKRTIARWLVILLLATLLPLPAGTPVALAQQNIPAACRNDNGQPILTAPIIGAWALALNFNHAPSTSSTIGCRIMTVALSPHQAMYDLVTCTIHNNSSGIQVGNGTAPFDGKFWITCPNGPPVPGYGPSYDGFAIYGRAQFPTLTAAAAFKIVEHQDVELTATVNPNAHVRLNSRYGAFSYESTDSTTNVVAAPVFFGSFVTSGLGRHQVEQNIFNYITPVEKFPFTFTQPLTIGRAQKPWTLHELVIDPPPPRGGFSG